jgi:hypothetical protein
MATAIESPVAFPESPMDAEEAAYPCKGCGNVSGGPSSGPDKS